MTNRKQFKVNTKVAPRGKSFEATISWTPEKGASRRERISFATENEAEMWAAEAKVAIMRGGEPDMLGRARKDDKPRTLADMIEYVFANYWKEQAGGEKQRQNAYAVADLLGRSKMLSKIGAFEINKVTAELKAGGNSGATINRKLAALRRCLTEAVKLEVISSRPTWKKQKETEGRIARISRDLERRMLAWCKRMSLDDIHDFILWSIKVGSRNGESLKITFADVNLRGKTANFPAEITKNKKFRAVPIEHPAVIELVERRRKAATSDEQRIFAGLTKRKFDVQWEKMREAFDLVDDPDFVPHVIRHEFCSRLAEANASASYIQMLAGHLTLAVSQRYVHMFGKEALEGARRFVDVDAEPVSNVVAMEKARNRS
ncbi:integrase [Rhodoblastus acidophilus]|uniref:tyrosine-type recombinase/integrase n=1 Tax=Rhodoblastus acidophilus TaxID=1074 RepID=UPI0022245E2C|nr:tyrosine-type recombinase/integrase [Rhodoblastus acidophilus]MCW2285623.1 integrase [Rhodoblastus acidophilus]MCW2334619.1 integrase [Rhodoblastus acidophilus]